MTLWRLILSMFFFSSKGSLYFLTILSAILVESYECNACTGLQNEKISHLKRCSGGMFVSILTCPQNSVTLQPPY